MGFVATVACQIISNWWAVDAKDHVFENASKIVGPIIWIESYDHPKFTQVLFWWNVSKSYMSLYSQLLQVDSVHSTSYGMPFICSFDQICCFSVSSCRNFPLLFQHNSVLCSLIKNHCSVVQTVRCTYLLFCRQWVPLLIDSPSACALRGSY